MPSSTCYPVVGGSGERGWSTRVHTLSRENGGEREAGRKRERERGPVHILEILQPLQPRRMHVLRSSRRANAPSILSRFFPSLRIDSFSPPPPPPPSSLPRDYTRTHETQRWFIWPVHGDVRVIYRDLIAFNPTGAIVNRKASSAARSRLLSIRTVITSSVFSSDEARKIGGKGEERTREAWKKKNWKNVYAFTIRVGEDSSSSFQMLACTLWLYN